MPPTASPHTYRKREVGEYQFITKKTEKDPNSSNITCQTPKQRDEHERQTRMRTQIKNKQKRHKEQKDYMRRILCEFWSVAAFYP